MSKLCVFGSYGGCSCLMPVILHGGCSIDIGFDDNLLARREAALAKCVQHNTLQQRQENESFRNHPFRQQVELSRSELVEVICQVIPSPCYGRPPSRSLDWQSDLWETHEQLAEALVDLNREDDSGR
jgi:hypothetical protein